jgi:hypothetical protein
VFWTLFIVRIKYKMTTFRKLVLLFGSTVVVASELFTLRSPVCYYQRMFRAARWREAIAAQLWQLLLQSGVWIATCPLSYSWHCWPDLHYLPDNTLKQNCRLSDGGRWFYQGVLYFKMYPHTVATSHCFSNVQNAVRVRPSLPPDFFFVVKGPAADATDAPQP